MTETEQRSAPEAGQRKTGDGVSRPSWTPLKVTTTAANARPGADNFDGVEEPESANDLPPRPEEFLEQTSRAGRAPGTGHNGQRHALLLPDEELF